MDLAVIILAMTSMSILIHMHIGLIEIERLLRIMVYSLVYIQ